MHKLVLALLALLLTPAFLQAAIPVKVVIVSMFEIGDDTGDVPGEFQFWIERNEVKRIEAPVGWRDDYLREDGLLLMCTRSAVRKWVSGQKMGQFNFSCSSSRIAL